MTSRILPKKANIDIPLLRKRLKYAFRLLRWNGVGRKQKFDDADMAKSAVLLCIKQVKGVRKAK